ncbi:MAG TPA: hypothetical protein G4N95_02620 [Anaerolineae bacterium]|nr:hypothetical protein [Anaerolineae bacterium]
MVLVNRIGSALPFIGVYSFISLGNVITTLNHPNTDPIQPDIIAQIPATMGAITGVSAPA